MSESSSKDIVITPCVNDGQLYARLSVLHYKKLEPRSASVEKVKSLTNRIVFRQRWITSSESHRIAQRAFHTASQSSICPRSVPYGHFSDAKNHKPPAFSRKTRGLCLLNVAVKERFELSIQFLVYTLSRRAP